MTTMGRVGSRACMRGRRSEAFGAGGGVAGVIEVHEQAVEGTGFEGCQHCGRRSSRLDGKTFAFEQQADSFYNVALIVSY